MATNLYLNGDIVDHGHLERLDSYDIFVNGSEVAFVLGWTRDQDGPIGVFTPAAHAAGSDHLNPTAISARFGDQIHVDHDIVFTVTAPHPDALRQVPCLEAVRTINYVSRNRAVAS